VDGIRHLRIGHDGRGVGVHQDDPVTLFTQRLAGLGAGIIELARLADDDRAGADDQDALDVGALRHLLYGPESQEAIPADITASAAGKKRGSMRSAPSPR